MATPVNCPNCGSTLAPGVTVCARCGHKLDDPPPETPAAGPQFTKTPAPLQPTQIKLNLNFAEMRARWGLEQSPYLLAAVALWIAAIGFGTLGHILFLTASTPNDQASGQSWFNIGIAAAIGAVAMGVLVHWQQPSRKGGALDDQRIVGVLGALSLLWIFIAIIFGFSKRLDPETSWFYYAELFAFATMAWCVISRPLPAVFGTMKTQNIGFAGMAACAIALFIGLIMSGSNSYATYSKGVSFQDLGFVLVVLVLAAFLGLAPEREGK